jgi:dsRNA-specific ribonuclease
MQADTFEAFVAAVFIDAGEGSAGYEAARTWVLSVVQKKGRLDNP